MNKLQKILGLGALVVAFGGWSGCDNSSQRQESIQTYKLPPSCVDLKSSHNEIYLCEDFDGNYSSYYLNHDKKAWILQYRFVKTNSKE